MPNSRTVGYVKTTETGKRYPLATTVVRSGITSAAAINKTQLSSRRSTVEALLVKVQVTVLCYDFANTL